MQRVLIFTIKMTLGRMLKELEPPVFDHATVKVLNVASKMRTCSLNRCAGQPHGAERAGKGRKGLSLRSNFKQTQ